MTLPVFLRNVVTSSGLGHFQVLTEARERGKVRIKSHGISASDFSTVRIRKWPTDLGYQTSVQELDILNRCSLFTVLWQ